MEAGAQFGEWLVLVEQQAQMAMAAMEGNYLEGEEAVQTTVLQAQAAPGEIIV
jgi:hypothetical protein